ncbi:MAG: HlyD family secretion protein [Desulfobacteraceae bacterium]|nr:HlyD family secretion protein [Desulfobacteraceae bacterium]
MPETQKNNRGRTTAAAVLIVGILALVLGLARFIHHRMAYALSDAVFVNTDSLVTVSLDRVSGQILELRKKEGDPVKAGEVLAVLDSGTYRRDKERLAAAIQAASDDLTAKELQRRRLATELNLNEKLAASRAREAREERTALIAKSAGLKAEIGQLRRDRQRLDDLYQAQVVSRQAAEDAATKLTAKEETKKGADAQATAQEAAIAAAALGQRLAVNQQGQLQELDQAIQGDKARIKALSAQLDQALADIEACTVKSPLTGRVAKSYLTVGAIAAPQVAIFSLVDPQDVFFVALMEENKLQGIIPGAPATITVDAYPNHPFRGEVSRVLPASAATFALAPRDISAGEFTKVAQRIPVRIAIKDGDRALLRIGMGGEVEIKRQGRGS